MRWIDRAAIGAILGMLAIHVFNAPETKINVYDCTDRPAPTDNQEGQQGGEGGE